MSKGRAVGPGRRSAEGLAWLARVGASPAETWATAMRWASKHRISVVPRGAGTGLSGGAIASSAGMIISFARMNRILEIDIPNERAIVEPGVVNLDLSLAVAADGYFYAPDPSSQRG